MTARASALPLIRAFVDNGAVGGALTISRWHVVGLVVAVLLVGAVVAGYGFDLLLEPRLR